MKRLPPSPVDSCPMTQQTISAAIGQVWTCHYRSSRACPTAFITLLVHHVFIQPLALLVFQTVPCSGLPPLLGSELRVSGSRLYRLGTLIT